MQALLLLLCLACTSCTYLANAALDRADSAVKDKEYLAAERHIMRAAGYVDTPTPAQHRRMMLLQGKINEGMGFCPAAVDAYRYLEKTASTSDEGLIAAGKLQQLHCTVSKPASSNAPSI